jgi:hypothetical protein
MLEEDSSLMKIGEIFSRILLTKLGTFQQDFTTGIFPVTQGIWKRERASGWFDS